MLTGQHQTRGESAVRDVVNGTVDAWRSNDAEASASFYKQDASVVLPGGTHLTSRDEIRDYMAAGLSFSQRRPGTRRVPTDGAYQEVDVGSRWVRPGVAVAAAAMAWTAAACGGADEAGADAPGKTPAVGGSTGVIAGGGSGTPGGAGTPSMSSPGGSGGTGAPGPSTGPGGAPGGGTGTCATDQLSVSLGAPDSAKFEEDVLLVFTNTGGRPCSLSGFVKLQLRGPSAAMPTTVTPQPGSSAVVILNHGQQASTRLLWNKYEGQGSTCPPFPVSIAVTPPGGQAARTIPWLPGDDGSVCGGGAIRVYPVVAGTQGS